MAMNNDEPHPATATRSPGRGSNSATSGSSSAARNQHRGWLDSSSCMNVRDRNAAVSFTNKQSRGAGAAVNRHERLNRLLELLSERGQLEVDEAATELGASVATIRRDLDHLGEQQLLTRT